jgi:hypothetical protein
MTLSAKARNTGPSSDVVEAVLERACYCCEVCGSPCADQRGTDWSIHHRRVIGRAAVNDIQQRWAWVAELRAQIKAREEAGAAKAEERRRMAVARAAGKARRHAERLRRRGEGNGG